MEFITAGQLRAARGLLGLSQKELAAVSKVSRATIADFEAGKRQPYPRTLADLQRAVESAGVDFLNDSDLLGVKIKRSSLLSPAAVSPQPVSRLSVNAKPDAPLRAEVTLHRRRTADRIAESAITPEQVKVGRELLGWSQLELANQVGVSETAISLFEREKRRLLMVDVSQLRAALKSAGVDFINTDGSTARLKPKEPEIALDDFLAQLDWYEHQKLRPNGIFLSNRGSVKHGFAFLYLDRSSASLMLEGKALGRVRWSDGTVEFEPAILQSDPLRTFEEKLEHWASGAYAKSLSGTEPKPAHNFRLHAPRLEDSRAAQQPAGSSWLRRAPST